MKDAMILGINSSLSIIAESTINVVTIMSFFIPY